MSDHTPQLRNTDDVWPDDVPVGTFHLERSTLEGRPSVSGHLMFVCPNGHRCGVLVGPVFENRRTADDFCVWGWDGNEEAPTLTPSINCITEKDGKPTGGCGWHGHFTAGRLV